VGAGDQDDDGNLEPELQEPTGEVGDARAGRLAEEEDYESDLYAEDVGIDGAGAGAEEAAVHLVDGRDLPVDGEPPAWTRSDIEDESR
jgi:hypothetical protein